MKHRSLCLLSLIFSFALIFVFSCGALAASAPSANEEGDDSGQVSTFSVSPSATTSDGNLIIVLDPGHGGNDSGATSTYNGTAVYEKTINLKVAQYCKAYLEQYYSNVTVYLTRSDNNTALTLDQRAAKAADYGADLVISMHFNSTNSSTTTASGCEVYVSRLEEYSLSGLASQIGANLAGVGMKNNGVKTRASETNTYWLDGTRLADYYGIIKHPIEREIPSMIVEHCFLNNGSDYANYISSDTQLKSLGEADAKAIASYFSLGENISPTTLANAKATAQKQLDDYYNALNLDNYTGPFMVRIHAIYKDASARIASATGTGKINLTLNRALKTIQNYPLAKNGDTGYTDVNSGNWFRTAVMYCVKNGVFQGTSDTAFSPGVSITRGQFITVIGRTAGASSATPASTVFSDVDSNAYYAPYIAWGYSNNIVEGLTPTTFGPEQSITREDLVTILYRYANEKGITLSGDTGRTLANFSDGSTVDSWATEAMTWAVAHGVINGSDQGKISPRAYTTRAEAAQIMMTFTKQS